MGDEKIMVRRQNWFRFILLSIPPKRNHLVPWDFQKQSFFSSWPSHSRAFDSRIDHRPQPISALSRPCTPEYRTRTRVGGSGQGWNRLCYVIYYRSRRSVNTSGLGIFEKEKSFFSADLACLSIICASQKRTSGWVSWFFFFWKSQGTRCCASAGSMMWPLFKKRIAESRWGWGSNWPLVTCY